MLSTFNFQLKSTLIHLRGGHFPEEYAVTDAQVVLEQQEELSDAKFQGDRC